MKSAKKTTTHTGKIGDNVGFPKGMKGVTRKLSKSDIAQMKRNGIQPFFTATMV